MAAQTLENRTGMGQYVRIAGSRGERSDSERAAGGQLASSAQRTILGELEERGDLGLNLIESIGSDLDAPCCEKQGAKAEKPHPEVHEGERG